jgi:hypothetical protein
VRNLRKVNLKEVSLVLFPMAPGARIDTTTVKSLSTASLDEFIDLLRGARAETLSAEQKSKVRQLASLCGPLCKTEAPAAPSAPALSADPPAPMTPTPEPDSASADPAPDGKRDEEDGAPATPAAPTPPAAPLTTSEQDDAKTYGGLPAPLFVEAVQESAAVQIASFHAYLEKYQSHD